MRPPLLLATVLLATLTAFALVGAAVAVRPPGLPPEADGPDEATNRSLAYAFYDAVNAAIATGDLAPLAALVAPDLLDGEAAEGSGAGDGGLRRRLLALHATQPTLRLTVEAIAVDGDLAIARVGSGGAEGTTFLGLNVLDGPAPWGGVDVLVLADGRIVAHTSDAAAALIEPALMVPRDLPADGPHTLAVRRINLAAGATHVAAAADAFRLVYVDAGTVTVGVVATSVYAARPAALAAGEHLAIPAGVAYAARNTGDAPAVLLDLAASRPLDRAAVPNGPTQPLAFATPQPGTAAGSTLLAHSQWSELPTGPAVLAVGRATLAPGARLAWAAAAGPVLLHVEAGAMTLDPTAGIAWVQDGSGRAVTLGDDPVPAGNGALVVSRNNVDLHVGEKGPATILIVTLLPADAAVLTGGPGPVATRLLG